MSTQLYLLGMLMFCHFNNKAFDWLMSCLETHKVVLFVCISDFIEFKTPFMIWSWWQAGISAWDAHTLQVVFWQMMLWWVHYDLSFLFRSYPVCFLSFSIHICRLPRLLWCRLVHLFFIDLHSLSYCVQKI